MFCCIVCLCVGESVCVCKGSDPITAARFLGFSVFFFLAYMCQKWEELTLDRCHAVHIDTHGETHQQMDFMDLLVHKNIIRW